MHKILIALIGLFVMAAVTPVHAGGWDICKTRLACDDDIKNGTKNDNGRAGQASALGASLDSRIANPGERINLDMNWTTNEIGGPGAVGGAAFFNIPELDEHLYIGVRGGYGFEGQGTLVGVGVSYAFSPF